jgi:hypothetical protein
VARFQWIDRLPRSKSLAIRSNLTVQETRTMQRFSKPPLSAIDWTEGRILPGLMFDLVECPPGLRHSHKAHFAGKELQVPKRRVGRYLDEIRRMVVERFRACKNIVALSRELGVHRRLLNKLLSSIRGEAA